MDYALLALLLIIIILLVVLFFKINNGKKNESQQELLDILQKELKDNRFELAQGLRENREELNNTISRFQQNFMEGLKNTGEQQQKSIERLNESVIEKLDAVKEGINLNSKLNREELGQSLKSFQESFSTNVKDFNDLQKQKFDDMGRRQEELIKSTELKLEKMRETVDEKLHKTLEDRLGQSFKIVSDQLQAVQKGLGEMQNLAAGVGDLKKVLSNVKTRGVLGEIQLGNILEQIMAPEQYEANVKTKAGSNDMVEYAIKLPGKDELGKEVYLPVDAKFPQEDYLRLQTAYENSDLAAIELNTKALVNSIKKSAKDIRDKYIDPPNTTDFGILFLPFEGLFAEVVRQPELILLLQRDFKIIVTGPTTLAAMLNSLQMGFKTLAIQKRSSEVWEILGAVKTEFGKFGGVLEKAQRKINEANTELDKLVTTRTNAINRKLREVQELPSETDQKEMLDKVIESED